MENAVETILGASDAILGGEKNDWLPCNTHRPYYHRFFDIYSCAHLDIYHTHGSIHNSVMGG